MQKNIQCIIHTMNKPEKEVTIYDIAKKLNISAATVSRGLQDRAGTNKDTKKRILDAAAEMGYHSNSFASKLRNKRSNIIGVIVPRLNSVFMSQVIAGIEKEVSNANFTLIISQSLENMKKEAGSAAAMYSNRVDGLLVSLAYDTKSIEHFENFIKRGTPVVFFDRVYEDKKHAAIYIDNYKAAYEVTTHLIEQGCKRIVHLTGNQMQNVYADRFKGYKQALTDHQIPFNEDMVIISGLSSADGAIAAEQILKMKPLPDGVFAANDQCVISCMQVLKKEGLKIPEDIAVAGFNNDPVSCIIEPNLTTINYKGYEMGQVAAKLLMELMYKKGAHSAENVVLNYELIIRESSLRNGKKS
ncbi:MAG: LacI family DNA-binding transcriptional regulator [Mucilaginibacter sp.]|nr:LacI family DNA-binding transcriptional regulator [Mucilaginibacter sp.]MDB5112398.1 LacI family DNA-binding transcriptional regulator [Mucilaginibacter sp.]